MNRPETFTMVFPSDAPCGCERGKPFGECHLIDGQVKLAYKDINPRGKTTNKSIRKCHFAFTNNCDGGISREHIISKAVLKQITEKLITITKDEYSRTVAIDSSSLTTKRLCRRHNTAVHGLDVEAGRFIRAIRRAEASLGKRIDTRQLVTFFHGFDVERWLLKTLLNVFYSGPSGPPAELRLPNGIPNMLANSLQPPYGLYLRTKEDDSSKLELQIAPSAAFHLIGEGDTVVGVSVTLAGLELKLVVAGTLPYTPEFQKTHAFRPKTINFFEERDVISIMIVWIDGSPHDVWISRGDKSANHPNGIGGLIAEHLQPVNLDEVSG